MSTPTTAETVGIQLFSDLTAGIDLALPAVNLSDPAFAAPATPAPLANDQLTVGAGSVGGTGTFDVLMSAFKAHLDIEFNKNRISGAEYSKTYIALTQAAMANAVQFLLGRDQAYWQAQLLAVQTITAKVQLEAAKAQLAAQRYEALTAEANFALSKIRLATENVAYDTAAFQLSNILPAQARQVSEQAEAARAQTLNTRSDGQTVAGTSGAQVALYNEQVVSYKRDAENKGVKLFTDAWITMKTLDNGLLPPNNFTNSMFDKVLDTLRDNLGLGGADV